MRALAWRAASWLMLVAFLLSMVVQLNDPDPLPWIALYGAAALACTFDMRGRGRWPVPAAVGVAALMWSASIAARVVGRVPFGEMFGAFEMESVAVEEAREMYGLLIVAVWMAVLTIRALRAPRRHEAGPSG